MKKHSNLIQTLIGVALGAVFMYFTFRNSDFNKIINGIRQADPMYIILNGVCLWVVYYIRALRWNVLLKNSNLNVRKRNLIHAVMLGYFVNSFTPKLGELMRCKILYDREEIPVSQALATVVAERVYDMVTLLIGIALVFVFQIDTLQGIYSGMAGKYTSNSTLTFLALVAVLLVCIGSIYLIVLLHKNLKYGMFKKLVDFTYNVLITLKESVRIKQYWKFLLYTVFIWTGLTCMNYFALKAIPATSELSIGFAATLLFVVGLGWAMPIPNGVGSTHYIVEKLFLAFALSEVAGEQFGILSNGLTLIYTLLFGGVYIFFAFIFKKKLQISNPAK